MTAHREERRQGDGPHAKAAVAGGSLSHLRIIALRHMPRNSGSRRRSALPLFHFWSLHVESAIRAPLPPAKTGAAPAMGTRRALTWRVFLDLTQR